MRARNKMFDLGILKQQEFDIPVVVVGNIAVGGTGKTPHTEYIIDTLRYSFHIGVVSRGYRRKTKGFVLATKHTGPAEIGDEPYQIYRKYGNDITIGVCEDRCRGIEELRQKDPTINLILLDDAFQHRYVKPSVSIVLTEFGRPAFDDHLLPLGRLRESMFALNRADIVVVTKCPDDMKPIECRSFTKRLDLYPYQKLFFSRFIYGPLVSVFPDEVTYIPYLNWLNEDDTILAIAGIANPRPFVKYLRAFRAKVKVKVFSDHHDFTTHDIERIYNRFKALPGQRKYIITTEKDAVKLACNRNYPQSLKTRTFYIPIKVQFTNQQGNTSFEESLRRLITEGHSVGS
jgi:tetraacyldisaccharide 4'-kinase